MAIALYAPQVSVNDIAIDIKPNTFTVVLGKGEYKTRTASGGGDRTTTYNTVDIETRIGQMKFTMYTTNESYDQLTEWKDRFASNTISFSEQGVSGTLNRAIIQNDPEIALGVEGEVEVIFHGNPVI